MDGGGRTRGETGSSVAIFNTCLEMRQGRRSSFDRVKRSREREPCENVERGLDQEMEDGSLAVGLFNLGESPWSLRVDGAELGSRGVGFETFGGRETRGVSGSPPCEVDRHGVHLSLIFKEEGSR